MKDCQLSNQVLVEATSNNPIQTIVFYQPPQTMDMPTNIKQILQEVSNDAIKQISAKWRWCSRGFQHILNLF